MCPPLGLGNAYQRTRSCRLLVLRNLSLYSIWPWFSRCRNREELRQTWVGVQAVMQPSIRSTAQSPMHSGKLNWTGSFSSVQFRSVFRCALNRRQAATTGDGRRTFLTVKNLRRPSQIIADSMHSGSSVQFSFPLCTELNNRNFKCIVSVCQFLPRDAMHKRGYCRHAVSLCPSVCLSVSLSRA